MKTTFLALRDKIIFKDTYFIRNQNFILISRSRARSIRSYHPRFLLAHISRHKPISVLSNFASSSVQHSILRVLADRNCVFWNFPITRLEFCLDVDFSCCTYVMLSHLTASISALECEYATHINSRNSLLGKSLRCCLFSFMPVQKLFNFFKIKCKK